MNRLRPYPFHLLWRRPISTSVRAMRALLRERPDTEHELTANRLLISSTILIYLVVAQAVGSEAAAAALAVAAVPVILFEMFALGTFLHILMVPGISPARRIAGIFADIGMFSYGLHASGEAGAALFLVYFWAVLGNGFRFGVLYLTIAAIAAVGSFFIVYMTTPFWQEQPTVSLGLVGALIVIPAYSSTLIRKLSQAKREAEQASQAKSLFLASMSHELRTPLNAVIALSDLLMQMRLPPEQNDMVRTIGRSGRSLLSLIEAVLDLSKIEAGQTVVQPQKVDLAALLGDVRSIIAVNAQKKGLRIAVHMAAGTPAQVMVDRRHLEEILLNLASNAVKFTQAGHVRIEVSLDQSASQDILRFAVSDTGIGIDASAHARIFERFTQADGTIMDRFGGTGLGLAIVKQLLRAMGGAIGVSSALGEGSTFHFHLPAEVVQEELQPSPAPAPLVLIGHPAGLSDNLRARATSVANPQDALPILRRISAETGRRPIVLIDARLGDQAVMQAARLLIDCLSGREEPVLVLVHREEPETMLPPEMRDLFFSAAGEEIEPVLANAEILVSGGMRDSEEALETLDGHAAWRILIADDNKTNQMVLGKILEMAGHHHEIVENGEAAVERMLKGGLDLVLMDVNMPVMNGIEATKFYHFAALGTRKIPIIAVTADATGEAAERCLDAGMAACVTKPIEPHVLLKIIASTLSEHGVEPVEILPPAEPEEDVVKDQPVIDPSTCSALEKLGGAEFVDTLLHQFADDSITALNALAAAVAEEDVHGFRNSAHALRSAAANVGAMRIYQMCLDWREINDPQLAHDGEQHVHDLRDEFQKFRSELDLRRAS
ncbi:ATP-binding protein [Rhizobium sp. SSA_523]|uniref:ATP-binding protein n=1 Tax=Rhizobium sp. SSA_523 TaxID=2952477 RepID=UPI0020911A7B|nr:ATP-binding protein [Rhizobium sp. SSA_523]MCO5734560.1 ATP-binding protein [Rhizobium sp. SSA_523]WKC23342.1 ATP-binding protein [Rhizobium sp. SSA_523]